MDSLQPIPDRYRFAVALAGGALLACAFPSVGVAGLAWVAPGILLGSALGVDGRMAFRLGYVGGLIHHLVALSWLLHIPVNKLAPVTGWLALSGFLALYQAVWVWLAWRCYPGARRSGPVSWTVLSDGFLAVPGPRRLIWALLCAGLWVALEMIQARLLTGFPWNLLGSSQYRMVPLLSVASVTGIYGVSFLAVWFGVSFLMAAMVVIRRSSQAPRQWVWEIALPLLVVLGVVAAGAHSWLAPGVPAAGPDGAVGAEGRVRMALVQPSIPQQWIWSRQDSSNRFAQLLALSGEAMGGSAVAAKDSPSAQADPAARPDIVVWPEAAVPGFLRWDTNTHDAVVRFARTNRVWMIIGADDVSPRQGGGPDDYDVFNASFLVSPRGEFVSRYAKRRLVIFGEYIPFVRWLPFLERWTGMGSFTPGRGPVPFEIPEKGLKTSVVICFEDIFPHLVREHVEEDTDFLLNLTNNGWFGESAAQWQHAAGAVFRAVENGLPLVRCANNGLTCWVDAAGRMREVYFPGTTDVYGRGVKYVDVPLRAGANAHPTFYRRHGDMFGWGCVAVAALGVAWSFRRRSRPPAEA